MPPWELAKEETEAAIFLPFGLSLLYSTYHPSATDLSVSRSACLTSPKSFPNGLDIVAWCNAHSRVILTSALGDRSQPIATVQVGGKLEGNLYYPRTTRVRTDLNQDS